MARPRLPDEVKIARGTYRLGRETARKAALTEDAEVETYREWLKAAFARASRGEDIGDTVERLYDAENYLRALWGARSLPGR